MNLIAIVACVVLTLLTFVATAAIRGCVIMVGLQELGWAEAVRVVVLLSVFGTTNAISAGVIIGALIIRGTP